MPAFKEVWAGIGDSIVVVGGDGLWNCHIHTDDVGAAIEAALDAGGPATSGSPTSPSRWRRSAGSERRAARRGAGAGVGRAGPAPTTAWWRWSPAKASAGSSARSACTTWWSGGQSMNPSTAEILEAVERRRHRRGGAAAQQQEHPAGRRAGRRAERQDGPGGADREHRRGLRRAARLRPRPPAPSANAAPWPSRRARVVAGEVTRAVRDTTTDAGEVREGDWIGLSRDGVVSIAESAVRRMRLLLEPPGRRRPRARDGDRGGGRDAGRHPADHRVAAEERPGVAVEVHHGGQPLYPYLFGHRVRRAGASGDAAHTRSTEPAAVDSELDDGVGAQGGRGAGRVGIETVLDLLTTYPRRYLDRTARPTSPSSRSGDEAVVFAEVQRCARAAATGAAGRSSRSTSRTTTGALDVTFFNQPWRAKQLPRGRQASSSASSTSTGAAPMVNPVVDVVVGVDERRAAAAPDDADHPGLPRVGQGGAHELGAGACVEEALERAGEFADPLPTRGAGELELGTAPTRCGRSTSPRRWPSGPARRRLVFDELFRLQLRWCARRASSATPGRCATTSRPREIPGRSSGTLVARFLGALPFELTGAQRRAIAEIFADLAGPPRCTGCSRATSARARPWSRGGAARRRSRAATRAR